LPSKRSIFLSKYFNTISNVPQEFFNIAHRNQFCGEADLKFRSSLFKGLQVWAAPKFFLRFKSIFEGLEPFYDKKRFQKNRNLQKLISVSFEISLLKFILRYDKVIYVYYI